MSKTNKRDMAEAMERRIQELKKKQEETAHHEQEDMALPTNYDELMLGFKEVPQNEVPIDLLDPAPREWNFFRPIKKESFIGLMQSIEQEGVLHPIIVWEQDNGRYMILSGHNRYNAVKTLFELTSELKYERIPAFVKASGEINEVRARRLIIATNYFQRQMNRAEKIKAVMFLYNELKNQEQEDGSKLNKIMSKLAEQTGMSRRNLFYYASLENLIEPLSRMVINEMIPLSGGLALSRMDQETQHRLYEEFKENLNLRGVTPHMNYEQVYQRIQMNLEKEQDKEQVVVVSFTVPRELQEEVRHMVEEFLSTQNRQSPTSE